MGRRLVGGGLALALLVGGVLAATVPGNSGTAQYTGKLVRVGPTGHYDYGWRLQTGGQELLLRTGRRAMPAPESRVTVTAALPLKERGTLVVSNVVQLSPEAPVVVAHVIAESEKQVFLDWNEAAGALSYEVLRNGVVVGTTKSVRFVDESAGLLRNVAFTYVVRAVGSVGSADSGPVVAQMPPKNETARGAIAGWVTDTPYDPTAQEARRIPVAGGKVEARQETGTTPGAVKYTVTSASDGFYYFPRMEQRTEQRSWRVRPIKEAYNSTGSKQHVTEHLATALTINLNLVTGAVKQVPDLDGVPQGCKILEELEGFPTPRERLYACELGWKGFSTTLSPFLTTYGGHKCDPPERPPCERQDTYMDNEGQKAEKDVLAEHAPCPCAHVKLAGVNTATKFEEMIATVEALEKEHKPIILDPAENTQTANLYAYVVLNLFQRGFEAQLKTDTTSYISISDAELKRLTYTANSQEGTTQGVRKKAGVWVRCGYTTACMVVALPGAAEQTFTLPTPMVVNVAEEKTLANTRSTFTIKGGEARILRCLPIEGLGDCPATSGFFGALEPAAGEPANPFAFIGGYISPISVGWEGWGAGKYAPAGSRPYAPHPPQSSTTSPFNEVVGAAGTGKIVTTPGHTSAEQITAMMGLGRTAPRALTANGNFHHPVYYAVASDPEYTLVGLSGAGRCNYPGGGTLESGLAGAKIKLPSVAIPDQGGGTGGDHHLGVVEPNGDEYGFWCAEIVGSEIRAAYGYKTQIYGSGLTTQGATAAAFALDAGVIQPEEVVNGKINHAFFTVITHCRQGYVYPAKHEDCDETGGALPVEGARLWLDDNGGWIESGGYPPWKKAVLRAAYEYGLYIGDKSGGGFAFQMASELPYTVYGYPAPLDTYMKGLGLSELNLESGVSWATHLHVIEGPTP